MSANGDAVALGEPAGRCHLISTARDRVRPQDLARPLAAILGVESRDLAQRLRYSGGWLARDLEPELADRIALLLDQLGIAYHRVPAGAERPAIRTARRVEQRNGRIFIDHARTIETLDPTEIAFVDLVAFGTLREGEAERPDPRSSDTRMLIEALSEPFRAQRLAFADQRDCVRPLLHLITREPCRIFQFAPPLAGGTGAFPWIHRFLALVQGLVALLPPSRVTLETAAFWSESRLDRILISKSEELLGRLAWLGELARRNLERGET